MIFEASNLFKAIKDNNLETPLKTLKVINSGKEDINAKSSKNETYLHLVSHTFQKDEDAPCLIPVVFQLSNADIDRNAQDSDGNTALHIAARLNGTRRLIRVLIMIGIDPTMKNNENKTAAQLAKSSDDKSSILNFLSPGLWKAVSEKKTAKVIQLLENWCTVNESQNGVFLLEMAQKIGKNDLIERLQHRRDTVMFVHFALAGDRPGMRPYLNKKNININTVSNSYIDNTSGEFITMPLIGEAALLGLTAVVRKLLRKNCDIDINVGNTPLFIYIMQNIQQKDELYTVIEEVLDKIDLRKKSGHTAEVLDAAYDKKLPMNVLKSMAAKGLDLFEADDNGHFLRDRILIKNIQESPKHIKAELGYVDDIIVDMAAHGSLNFLQSLVDRNYEYIDVSGRDGKTAREELTKSKGAVVAENFFNGMVAVQKIHRNIGRVIDIGHLAQVQNMATAKVARVKDRFGRTLIHRAVIFERRHVLRHLIKVCPNMASCVDKDGRTALHWACALDDGDDMKAALIALGCKIDKPDKYGYTPEDFGELSYGERQAMLDFERKTDYGLDVYLYYKYLDLKEAVRAGNLAMVEEIRGAMYRDIPTKDISRRMYQTTPPQICLLQFAMDAKRDDIAKYFLTLGMDWDVKYTDGKEEISLLEAARRKEMKNVESYIIYQLKKIEDQKTLIQTLRKKGVVKNVKSTSDANRKQTVYTSTGMEEKSTSCVVQ